MSSSNLDIKALITAAWEKTLRQTEEAQIPDGKSEGRIHRDRSGAWVNCLGKGFRKHYQDEDQRVFWKQNESNTEQFGLNELLFDVSVCRVGKVKSVHARCLAPVRLEVLLAGRIRTQHQQQPGNYQGLQQAHYGTLGQQALHIGLRGGTPEASPENVLRDGPALHREPVRVLHRPPQKMGELSERPRGVPAGRQRMEGTVTVSRNRPGIPTHPPAGGRVS